MVSEMKTYDELKVLIDQRGVHAVFGDYGEGWGIEQNSAELAEFLVEMQKLGVTSILEVGTGWRAGLARFLHDDLGWRVTSVDIQNYGHAYSDIVFVHPDDFTYDAAFGVPAEQFDLVLLDADHSYDGVKDQHEFYAPYATKVVAFHDIAGLRDCEGVRDYWLELAGKGDRRPLNHSGEGAAWLVKHGYYEIIANAPERSGIGYIVLAEVADDGVKAVKTLLSAAESAHKADVHFGLIDPKGNVIDKPPVKPKPTTPRKPAARKPATTAKKAPVKK